MSIQTALVVDDSKVAHIKLRKLLEKRSIAVEWVNSGEKAITALKDSSPDIVFMDIMMPGIDGFETTKTVLANPSNADLAVVMCSGNDSAEDRNKANSIGAAGYIRKPYTDEELSKVLEEVGARIKTQAPAAAPAETAAEPAAAAAAEPAVDMAAIINQATTAGTKAAEAAFERLSILLKDEVASIASAAAKDAAQQVADEMEGGLDRSEVERIAQAAADKVAGTRVDQAIAAIPAPAPGLDASAVTNAIRHFITGDDFKRQVASAVPAPQLDKAQIAQVAGAAARDVAEQSASDISRNATDMARKVAEDTARRAAQEAASGGPAVDEDAIKSAVGGAKTMSVLSIIGVIGIIAYLALSHLGMI